MSWPRATPPDRSGRLALIGGIAALLSVLPLLDVTLTDDWLLAATVAVAAVAISGYLLRTLGLPKIVTPLFQMALLVLWLGVLVARDVALLGFIPTVEWGARLVDVFRVGVNAIQTYLAPVPVPPGLLLMLVGGAGLVAMLVDALVAAARRVALAGLPLGACYAVAAAVTPGGVSWWWFLAPAAGFLALLISEGRGRVAAWGRPAAVASTGPPSTDSLARNGRRVSVVTLAAAVAIPAGAPILTDGIVSVGGRGGGSGGQTIRTDNPIVDLQRNLQRPENVDILRYRSSIDEPHYIRTVTLDVFNGEVWQTSDRAVPESVGDGLPRPQGMQLQDVSPVDYTFQVTDNYSSRWLPLPYPAQNVDIDGDWRYHNETLDVVSTEDDVRATTYTVRGLDIKPTTEQLRTAGEPRDEVAASLALPDDLPPVVGSYATEVTAGATDDFGRAAALQDWFRSKGGFIYDIESQPGHSSNALVDFLTERRGYCEQFAASMAIMARTLGIPSRVAVGFTPGDPVGDSTWVIRAHDSHAWPELYFEGTGWVRFEPTPPFRSGRAPDWTFVPDNNSSDDSPGAPAQPLPESSASGAGVPIEEQLGGGLGVPGDTGSSPWLWASLAVGVVVALLCLPWLAAQLLRRRRWRLATGNPAASANAAWDDLRDAARDAGVRWDRAETPRATSRRIAAEVPLSDEVVRSLDRLIIAAEQAWYAGSSQPAATLCDDASTVRRGLISAQPATRRAAALLWPTTTRKAIERLSATVTDLVERGDGAVTHGRESLTKIVRPAAK